MNWNGIPEILTIGGEHDFDQRLIDNFRGCVDQLQDIRTVVVVSEEQQAVCQLAQPIVGQLEIV